MAISAFGDTFDDEPATPGPAAPQSQAPAQPQVSAFGDPLSAFGDPLDAETPAQPVPSAQSQPQGWLAGIEQAIDSSVVGDAGRSVARGGVAVGDAAMGIAGLLSGGAIPRAVGYDSTAIRQHMDQADTSERQASRQALEQAQGFGGTVQALAQNPGNIPHLIAESVPSMLAGGGIGRGVALGAKALGAAPVVAGVVGAGTGEGIVAAGQQAEQTRQQTGTLTPGQSGLAVASGALTGLLGAAGARIGRRLGVADIDAQMAGAGGVDVARSLVNRALTGSGIESLEELTQSGQQQVLTNLATDRPALEGVDKSMTLGAVVGGVMGGAAGLRQPSLQQPVPPVEPQPAPIPAPLASAPQPQPQTQATAPINLPADLARATPRYGLHQLNFENDIDLAAYIAAQANPSKRDADYLNFAMQATGMSEAQVRRRGADIRDSIKAQTQGQEPGTFTVPSGQYGAVPSAPVPSARQTAPAVPFAGSADVRPLFESMGLDQQQMDKSLELLQPVEFNIDDTRRGAIPWEETGRLAALAGITPEKLRKHRVGVAFNAEEQLAATRLLKDQTIKTLDLGSRISSGNASETDQANFLQSLADLRSVQTAVMSSRAEIGRAMAIMRADVTTSRQVSHLLDGVGGAQGAKAIADALTNAARTGGVEAANKLARQAGSDGFWTFYKSMLLSSPDTHIVNMVSNLFTSALQVPTRALAGGIGAAKRAVGLNGETRMGEAGYQLAGMLEGAVNGARGAVSSWQTGEDAFGGENKAEVYRTDYPGQKVWGVPLRLLQSEDQFFKYLNDGMARYAGAYRMASSELKGQGPAAVHKRVQEIISNPTQELVDAGQDAALFHTFNNTAGKITQAVNNLRHSFPYGTGNLVIPFLKTPSNLIAYAVKHSPAAPVFKEVRQDIAAGGHRQEEALARMGIGSILISLGAVGAMNGNLTGGGPEDPEARKAWLAAGNQPYSLKINGRWHQYSRIEPIASLVGVAADVASGAQDQALGMSSIIKAIGRNFTSKTWLQGLSGVMQAMTDPDRYGGAWLNRSAATLAQPATLLSHLGRYGDEYQRETDRDSFLDQLKYRLPGEAFGRESLPIKRDQFGAPLLEPQRQIGRAGPIPSTAPSDDPVRQEAARLGWVPAAMDDHFTVQGSRHSPSRRFDLTDEQQRELGEMIAQRVHAAARNAIGHPEWRQLDDDSRVKYLDKITRQAKGAAKKAYVPYLVSGKRGLIDLYRKQTSAWTRTKGGNK